jgi:membrane peptidoglycan carboxypeptidase
MAKTRAGDWGAFTLGVAQTTPLDLANAYATVAADGIYCKPLPVLSITGPNGDRFHAADPACHRVVSSDVARAATDAARCPVGQQSVYGRCNGGTAPEVGAIFGGRPVAGKTGSSEHNATETFVGFTPQIAGAAIAADPDNPSDAVGGGVASSVDIAVARTLADALRGKPVLRFPAPSRAIAFGRPSR